MGLSWQTYACLGLGLALLGILCTRSLQANLPPGPSGYPIVGNFFDMPKSEEWLYWAHLGEKYGTARVATSLESATH
jgi:hypothetical protein